MGSKKKRGPNLTITGPILGQTQHKIRKPKGKFPKLLTTGEKKNHWLHFQISKGLMWWKKTKSRAFFFSKGSKYSTFHLITQQLWSGDASFQLHSPMGNIVANIIDRATKMLILPSSIIEQKWWTHNQLQTSPIRKRKRWLTKKSKRKKSCSTVQIHQSCHFRWDSSFLTHNQSHLVLVCMNSQSSFQLD